MSTPQRKLNIGRAIELDEAEDPELAEPDERDIQQADERVKLSTLLLALWAGFLIWDRAKLRYRTKAGELIPNSAINGALERVIRDSQQKLRTISQTLIDRQMALPAWQMAVRDELKIAHYIAGTVAQGGPEHMSPAAIRRIGELTQPQYERLNVFARQIEAGTKAIETTAKIAPQPLNGRVLQRAALYGGAARSTFHETRIHDAMARGFPIAERVRHHDESCPGCVETEGFFPVEEVPPIGSQECLVNCLCSVEFHEELPEGERFNTVLTDKPLLHEIVRRQLELRQAIK